MSTVIWFFDRLDVPRRLDFDVLLVVPLTVRETAFREAAEADAALQGSELELSNEQLPEADAAAISIRVGHKPTPTRRLRPHQPRLTRSRRRWHFVKWDVVADPARFPGWRPERRPLHSVDHPRVTNLPFVSEEQELAAVVTAFADRPQAVVLADVFRGGVPRREPIGQRDTAWAGAEGLAEKLPGQKYDKVVAALRQLEIGEPMFDGKPLLLRRAYDVRNDLMHRAEPRQCRKLTAPG